MMLHFPGQPASSLRRYAKLEKLDKNSIEANCVLWIEEEWKSCSGGVDVEKSEWHRST